MKKEGLFMPEVQNVGAVDYSQYQPSQYQQETYAEDYNTQPEVYDESYAQMQEANKSRMGSTLLAGAIAIGLGVGGYFLGKRSGKSGEVVDKTTETLKKELEDLKNSEAVKNYDKLKTAAEEVEKYVEAKSWYNFHGVKDTKKSVEEVADKTKEKAEEVKKTAEKTTEETKND